MNTDWSKGRAGNGRVGLYERGGKRALDLLFGAILIVLVSPVLLVISILVALVFGRPVIFAQVRPGRRGKPFVVYKFRTMNERKDPDGCYLPDSARLTGFGRFLRLMSLDELPQLWNVLKGDMSLVGPRPLMTKYQRLCGPEHWQRLAVKPGLTGWAQINGRNLLSYEERFAHDMYYIENHSLSLDLYVLVKTPIILASGRGACGSEGNSHLGLEDAEELTVGAWEAMPTASRARAPAFYAPIELRHELSLKERKDWEQVSG